MKKVVFLTGGTGGMGTETIKKMIENPDEIELRVLARDSEKNREKLAVYGDKIKVIWGDLLDFDLLSESMNILTTSGLEGLDYYMIAEILMDEDFGYAAGLSSSEGIVAGASCASGMMTCAYSMVLVTLEEGADAAAIAADFEANVDWMKWVCVQPSNALICQKDNMVLCLVADGEAYTMTATAIGEAGWTEISALTNPNNG